MDTFNKLYKELWEEAEPAHVEKDDIIIEGKKLDGKEAKKIVKLLDSAKVWNDLYIFDTHAEVDRFYDVSKDKFATALFMTTLPLAPGHFVDANYVSETLKQAGVV